MDADGLVEAFHRMVLIRRFEERVSDLYRAGTIPGFVHVSIGQEACAVGVCQALGPEDYLTSTHRGHGHCLAKGMRPDRMMAELLGKADGYCTGKGGSMHIADPTMGVLGANGVVGAGLPLAVGAALACRLRGSGVAVAFFGEGAVTTGAFHESLNLAAIWELPVLFVCENNGYLEFTPYARASRLARVADVACAYGMEAFQSDGNDLERVFKEASGLVGRLRAGEGPFLLELETYRWHGHYEGDPQTYRSAEEVDRARQGDPIERCRSVLLEREVLDEPGLKEIEAGAAQEIEAAVRFAEESPYPGREELELDV